MKSEKAAHKPSNMLKMNRKCGSTFCLTFHVMFQKQVHIMSLLCWVHLEEIKMLKCNKKSFHLTQFFEIKVTAHHEKKLSLIMSHRLCQSLNSMYVAR